MNTSLLVPANVSLKMPVSCVEQGRWSWSSRSFSLGSHASPKLRSLTTRSVSQSVRAAQASGEAPSTASYRSDQGKVWRGVRKLLDETGTRSRSSSYHDAVEQHRRKVVDLVKQLEDALDGAAGVAVFVGNRFVSLDAVDRAETFDHLKPYLLDGAALEALAYEDTDAETYAAPSFDAVLAQLEAADAVSSPSVGEGDDVRLEVPGELVGAALAVDERVLHVSAFRLEPDAE